MKSPTPETQCPKGVSQIQSLICDVYFSDTPINTPGQDQQEGNWTWLNIWNLLTIKLKDKSFHNS